MKKRIVMIIALLSIGITAHALTPTPSPSPTPGIGTVSPGASVQAYYDGEWHTIMQEMVWQQIATPNGTVFADGLLHFMPLSQYVKNRDIPEAISLDGFEYRVTSVDDTQSVSSNLSVFRQNDDELQRLEEKPEYWDELEPGRYLFSIIVHSSGNDSSAESVSLLWVNR